MMDERRRFQIALGGVAACVLIAAMFVSSAPPLEYPAVPAAQPFVRVGDAGLGRATFPREALGTLQPAGALRPARRPSLRPVLQNGGPAELVAADRTTPPSAEAPGEGMPLPTREPRFVLSSAPAAGGARVPVWVADLESAEHDASHRGPLTGALATAGKEVGKGLRTAGRAIRAIF